MEVGGKEKWLLHVFSLSSGQAETPRGFLCRKLGCRCRLDILCLAGGSWNETKRENKF